MDGVLGYRDESTFRFGSSWHSHAISEADQYDKYKIYASRTLLFSTKRWDIEALAIELSLPHPDMMEINMAPPHEDGVESSTWQLAKAYVAVSDSGVHQLISPWLHAHATIEPFVIATRWQLSVLHPAYKDCANSFPNKICYGVAISYKCTRAYWQGIPNNISI